MHVYNQAGHYTVALTATAGAGSDTEVKVDYITANAAGGTTLITRTIVYTYDGLYRLTGAGYPSFYSGQGSSGESFQYAYDAAGNRTAYTATLTQTAITTYTYDAANRLTNVGGVAYTWDDLGRLVHNGVYTYTWDGLGRLITVTNGITATGFRYDGDGNRLARVANGTFTTYTLDVGLALPEVLVAHDGNTTRYLHVLHSIATDDDTGWSYSLGDHLSSVRQQVDATGQVASVLSYEPFGLPLEGDSGTPYGFTGEWWEADARLLFLRARFYHPYLNRFISPDIIVPDFTYPPSIHRYSYVFNNPVNLVDPSGHQVEPPACEPGEICATGTLGPYVPLADAFAPSLPAGVPGSQAIGWWAPYSSDWWSAPYEYDVARRYDPLFGNPYYYDPRYANDPIISANYALWRSGGGGCWKCHVTHWRGWIPSNEELSAYLIDGWHCFDRFTPLIILGSLGYLDWLSSLDVGQWGFLEYGSLDEYGRATGARGLVTEEMLDTGTRANRYIRPPGFQDGLEAGHARGHLIARMLGGSGDVPENLVTLVQNPVNSPVMRDFERQIYNAVATGENVFYQVMPIYEGVNGMPIGLTLSAEGDQGFQLLVTILNK